MNQINVTRSSMPSFEEYCAEIKDLWESRWLTNMGAKHDRFQKRLESYLNVPHVTLFTNGHLALEESIRAFGFPAGSEVITTPFTFASTTHAIVRNNLVPVFCDIRREDLTMDPTLIEGLISEKTVAILPVHVYGNMCAVREIGEIAKRHGLKLIYDAAHAFGVRLNGRSAACFGDISVFSFHATKVFHTIEGGAACCREEALVQKLEDLKNYGIRDEETVAGANSRRPWESAICVILTAVFQGGRRLRNAIGSGLAARRDSGFSIRRRMCNPITPIFRSCLRQTSIPGMRPRSFLPQTGFLPGNISIL